MNIGKIKWRIWVVAVLMLLMSACSDKQYEPMAPHANVNFEKPNTEASADMLSSDTSAEVTPLQQKERVKQQRETYVGYSDTIHFETGVKALFPRRVAAIKEVVHENLFGIKSIDSDQSFNELGRDGVVFHLLANVHFPSGKIILHEQERSTLTTLALALQQDGSRKVLIVGHSDSSGNMQANRRLSVQRARAVATIFVKAGFAPSQVFFQGVGEFEPVQSNKTKDGRAANRRIEIVEASDFSHIAKVRLKSIRESGAPKGILSATMLLKNMRNQFYVLPMFSTSFRVPVKGRSFTGTRLLKYGMDTNTKKKKKSFLSAFSSFFEVHADEDKHQKYPRIPNILGDIVQPSKDRLTISEAKAKSASSWQNGYEANIAPLAVMLPHGKHLDIPSLPISKDEIELSVQSPLLKFYTSQKSIKPSLIFKGYDKLYNSGNAWLYRWKSSNKTLAKYGLIGLDILFKPFKDGDFNETHVERFPALLYYVSRGKIMVTSVYVHKRLFKKEKITINYLKSFLPI